MRQIAVAQGIVGKAHKLFTGVSEDIQATDRVTIDSIEYNIRIAFIICALQSLHKY